MGAPPVPPQPLCCEEANIYMGRVSIILKIIAEVLISPYKQRQIHLKIHPTFLLTQQ